MATTVTYNIADAYAGAGIIGATVAYGPTEQTFDILAALVAGGADSRGRGGTGFSTANPDLQSSLATAPSVKVTGTSSSPSTQLPNVDVRATLPVNSTASVFQIDVSTASVGQAIGVDGKPVNVQSVGPVVPLLGSRVVAVGHSYLQGGGVTHVDRQFATTLSGMLRSDIRDLGVGGSLIALDQQWRGQTKSAGGWAWALQNIVPYRTQAPYSPGLNALPLICTGHNDVAYHSHDASGSPRQIFKSALRTVMSRFCAARLFEDTDASIAYGGSANWQVRADVNKNSGSSYRPFPANNATFTITLPADFEGGTVAVQLVAWPAGDGQVTWTGTASQLPATTSLAGMAYAQNGAVAAANRDSSNGVCVRIPGLTATDAGKTIIGTFGTGAGTAFSTPAAPGAITNVGTAGAVTYTYQRVYRTYNGDTLPSTSTSTSTGAATLNGTNYNSIPAGPAWPAGVEAELIVRTVGGTSQGIVAILTAGPAVVLDQAAAAGGGAYTAAPANPLIGGGAFDSWWIESNNPVTRGVICNIPKITAAALTSLGLTAADYANYNTDLNAVVSEFAGAQWLVVDIDSVMGGNAAYFAADGVHPNDRGHALIAQAAANAISAWSTGIPVSDQAHQSRVSRRPTSRAYVKSPTTGALWGSGGSGFVTLSAGVYTDLDPNNLLLAIDAQVGDDLEMTLSGMWGAVAGNGAIDCCTCDSAGNPVNYWTTGTSAINTSGQPCWFTATSVLAPITGSAMYTVQPNDITTYFTVPGIVLVKVRGVGNAKTIYLGIGGLSFAAHLKNLGSRNTPGFNAS